MFRARQVRLCQIQAGPYQLRPVAVVHDARIRSDKPPHAIRRSQVSNRIEPCRYPFPFLAVPKESTHCVKMAVHSSWCEPLLWLGLNLNLIGPLAHPHAAYFGDAASGRFSRPRFWRRLVRTGCSYPAPDLEQVIEDASTSFRTQGGSVAPPLRGMHPLWSNSYCEIVGPATARPCVAVTDGPLNRAQLKQRTRQPLHTPLPLHHCAAAINIFQGFRCQIFEQRASVQQHRFTKTR